ncbi:CapA family protein [Niallia sp. XMNu-256]|uniref:CapA family protein n=1 Tax=Niallia sp. XMNu-256 TaxID=3082444 RepID=UPI0030D15568
MKWGKLFYWLLLLVAVLMLSACGSSLKSQEEKEQNNGGQQEVKKSNTEEPSKVETTPPEPIVQTIQLSAVGDILIHEDLYNAASVGNNQYDFTPMFELVKPYMEGADITFANQETMIGGVELGLSTYPAFNSPVEIGDALKNSGVDIVSIANNHTLDRREQAVLNSIDHWNKIGMLYTGAYSSFEDQKSIRVIEKDGIKVAFIAYTYGTNGIPVPEGKEYLVNLIDKQRIKDEIDRAEEIADVVAVSLHFGNEYERMPNEAQKELVQFSVDEGADLIIGTHPHVLQPFSWVQGKDGNRAYVMYSLGNFFSGQIGEYKQMGGIASIEIEKVIDGEQIDITLKNPKFLPTYVRRQKDFKIIPMHLLTNDDVKNPQGLLEDLKRHMSQEVPELEFVS